MRTGRSGGRAVIQTKNECAACCSEPESIKTVHPSNTSAPHWRSQARRAVSSKPGAADHDESMVTGELSGDFGSIATNTIRPRWHRGHCRNERPVRSS